MATPDRNLTLALRLQAAVEGLQQVRGLIGEVDALGGTTDEAKAAAAGLAADLNRLTDQQKLIDNIRKLREQLERQAEIAAIASAKATELGRAKGEAARQVGVLKASLVAATTGLNEESAAAETTRARLAALKQESGAASKRTDEQRAAIAALELQLKAETAAIDISRTAVAKQTAELKLAERELGKRETALKKAATQAKGTADVERELRLRLQEARQAADAGGVSFQRLASEQVRVRQQTAATTGAIGALNQQILDQADATLQVQQAAKDQAAASAEAARVEAAAAEVRQRQAAELAAAYQRLGITSQDALDDAASAARRSFELIRSSGTTTARDLDAAFEAVAESELRAVRSADGARQTSAAYALRAQAATDAQRAAVERLIGSLLQSGGAGAKAGAQVSAGARSAQSGMDGATASADRLGGGIRSVVQAAAAIAGVNIGANLVGDLAAVADGYTNLRSRIDLAAGSAQAGEVAFERLLQVANSSGTSLETVAELYSRISVPLRELGASQAQMLDLTDLISKSLVVSGTSAQAASGAITQFAQALGSGVLRGDEFNSVMEQAPALAKALADGLGVPISALRGLAEQGKLTAREVTDALLSQQATIEQQYAQMPLTIGRAIGELRNNWQVFIGDVDQARGISAGAAEAISGIANNLDKVAAAATYAGGVALSALAVKGAAAARAFALQMAAAAAATGSLAAASAAFAAALPVAALSSLAIAYTRINQALEDKQRREDEAAEATRLAAEAEQELADTIADRLQRNAEFADVAILSGAALAAQNKEQAAEYIQQLNGAAQYYQALAQQLQSTGDSDGAARAAAKMGELVDALAVAEAGTAALTGKVAVAASAITEATGATAEFAAEAKTLEKLSALDLGQGIERLQKQLDGARDRVFGLKAAYSSAGEVLPEFEAYHRKAMGAALQDVAGIELAIQRLRDEQYARLGIEAEAVLSGIDGKSRELLDTLQALINDPSVQPEILVAGYEKLFATLDSPAELEALKLQLQGIAARGVDVTSKIADIDARIAELQRSADPKLKAIDDAFQTLGVTAEATLREQAVAAEAAYSAISESGLATAGDLDRAWVAMANAQLTAAAAAGDAQLQAAAATLELAAATDAQKSSLQDLAAQYPQLEAAAITTMGAAAAATDAAAQSAVAATEAVANFRQQLAGADTLQDIDNLRAALNRAFEEGQLAAQEYQAQLDALESKTKELEAATNAVTFAVQGYADVSQRAQAAIDEVFNRGAIGAAQINKNLYDGAQIVGAYERQARSLSDVMASLGDATAGTSVQLQGLGGDAVLSLEQVIERAERARSRMDLLDDADLSSLNAAIDSARSRLQSLRDSAADALASVQDSLDQIRGNEQAIEDRRNAQRLSDLQRQLAEAKAADDQESIRLLDEAIRKQKEYIALVQQQREEEARTAAAESSTSSSTTPSTPSSTPSTPASTAAGSTVTVRFVVDKAGPFDGVFEKSEAERLIEALETAAGVSLVN